MGFRCNRTLPDARSRDVASARALRFLEPLARVVAAFPLRIRTTLERDLPSLFR
jgi:hypothetical protein